MVTYAPVAQITGIASKAVSLTTRLPWLYIIVAVRNRVVYVGETHDAEGLLIRLGSHFGPFAASTLKRRASERAGIGQLKPPFLVVSARLPFAEDPASFDGTSATTRKLCEALVQQLVTERFVLKTEGWVIVSQTSNSGMSASAEVSAACESIYAAFHNALNFFTALSSASPFHLVVLDPYPFVTDDMDVDVGAALEDIEVSVFRWVLDRLKKALGELWWRDGIPQDTRINCQARRESDPRNDGAPAEAYLMFMDLKAIAKKNWGVCGPLMEQISEARGKDSATDWIQELNEVRNLWAHPIRRSFAPLDPAKAARIRQLAKTCAVAVRTLP
jgi:hypothetical protein